MQSDHVKPPSGSGSNSQPLNEAIKQCPCENSTSTHISSRESSEASSADSGLTCAVTVLSTKETNGSDLKTSLISSSETDATRAVLISNSSSMSDSVPLSQGEEKTTYTGDGPAFHRRKRDKASARSFIMFKLVGYCWGHSEAARLASRFQWPTQPPLQESSLMSDEHDKKLHRPKSED